MLSLLAVFFFEIIWKTIYIIKEVIRFRIPYMWYGSASRKNSITIPPKTTDWKNCATAQSIMNPFKNPYEEYQYPIWILTDQTLSKAGFRKYAQ